ncbi:putative stathmin domain-containing protein 1 [Scophthalmus maximus]|uniref:Putative stathmin domain-containing protein 1 n=2 Tax=Scophthalmus maximus TaxID=52904 RepID=A0A2U9CY72_SCOMX|nr:putative stathmin domain-containing protein 1 [Scophthalmus maximus]
MGCGGSTNTAVQPLTREQLDGDEDETGSKLGSRGDSAVSKGTTDSGVGMENKEIPVLPGAVPRKLPPLTSECAGESVADRFTHNGLLQQDSTVQERQKSSEILEELLNQGIIPVGQTRGGSSGAGEAYSIMLDDRDVVRRRPPARLESLRAKKEQSLPSREEIEEKIRLAEERRKLREDELKMRLRTKSAHVRVRKPISSVAEDEDLSLTPLCQITSEPPEGRESARENKGHGGEREKEMARAEKSKWMEKERTSGENGEDGDDDEEGDEVELSKGDEVQSGPLLTASGELESDPSFQHAEDKEEKFRIITETSH